MPNCAAAAPRATNHSAMERTSRSAFEVKRLVMTDGAGNTSRPKPARFLVSWSMTSALRG